MLGQEGNVFNSKLTSHNTLYYGKGGILNLLPLNRHLKKECSPTDFPSTKSACKDMADLRLLTVLPADAKELMKFATLETFAVWNLYMILHASDPSTKRSNIFFWYLYPRTLNKSDSVC